MIVEYFKKNILKTLAFKTFVLMTLILIITGFILNGWYNEGEDKFREDIFNSHTKLINELPKQKEDNKTQDLFDKNRELISLIGVIAKQGKFYHRKEIVEELVAVFMKNDGIMAFKIVDNKKQILIASQNENNNIILVDDISDFIVNDKSLGFIKEKISKNKNLGFMIAYFKLEDFTKDADIFHNAYLDKLNSFKDVLEIKSGELVQSNMNYALLPFLIILLIIALLIYVIVDMPLKKLKMGINNFLLVLNNKTKEVNKINIRTKDEFENIANFINENVPTSLEIHNALQSENKSMFLSNFRTTNDTKYALTTQNTLMAKDSDMNALFKDYFSFYKPKNIVGGNIYFFDKINDDEHILMCFDSAVYNLSGVLAGVLIKSVQYHLIDDLKQLQSPISPSKILSNFNKKIKAILNQDNKKSKSNTGFNGGVVYINKKTKNISYSGAYVDLMYIEYKKICLIPANKNSIGYKNCDADYKYEEYTIETSDNFKIYLSTDGFFNQLGGKKNYRFGKKRFKEMIEENHNKSFKEQKEIYIQTLADYQGDSEQVDDISFIGFKCDFK